MKFSITLLGMLFLTGCGQLTPHIQEANPTGKENYNHFDYFNNKPINYTSFLRSEYSQGLMTLEEKTDAFSGYFNLDRESPKGSVVFNSTTVILNPVSSKTYLEMTESARKDVVHYDRFYASNDGTVFIAVKHFEENIKLTHMTTDGRTDISFLPSRRLACKKISLLKQASDSAMYRSLLQTALVAGVQSYTSYSTTNSSGIISGTYQNFGYTGTSTTRDYSWAGERASEALTAIFSSDAKGSELQAAWNSLKCF